MVSIFFIYLFFFVLQKLLIAKNRLDNFSFFPFSFFPRTSEANKNFGTFVDGTREQKKKEEKAKPFE